MSLTCHLEYLNEAGKKSADYYSNLHLGHEAALRIYLDKNKTNVLTRFQKSAYSADDFFSTIKNISDAAENAKGERIYTAEDPKSGSISEIKSATRVVEEITNPFTIEQFAADYVIARKASEELYESDEATAQALGYSKSDFKRFKDNYGKYGYATIDFKKYPEAYEFMNNKASIYYKDNASEFETKKEEIKDKWNLLTEIGNDTHKLAEEFFTHLVKNPEDFQEAINNGIKSASSAYINDADAEAYLNSVIKLVFKNPKLPLLQDITKLKIYPEIKITNPSLTSGGRIDLLIVDGENNAYIFDIKSKELGKEALFFRQNQRMQAPVQNLYDNKFNQATMQTSVYHSALADWKVFNNISSYVLYTEGKVNYSDNSPVYSRPLVTDVMPLEYKKSEIDAIAGIDHLKQFKDSETYEVGKVNDANEVTNFLFGLDIDNMFTEEKLAVRIADILDDPKVDEKGNEYFYSVLPEDNYKRYFKSTDRAERILEIRDYYETLNKSNTRISDKFITYANNRPKDENKKDLQIDNLLKPYDPKLNFFQKLNSLPGYEHFDPSIVIVKNKITGEGSIINLNAYNDIMEREVKRGASNIFGNFVNNLTFQKLAGSGNVSLDYNKSSVQLLRGAMIAIDLQKKGYISTVKQISTGVISDGLIKAAPTNLGLNRLLPHLKVINAILENENQHSSSTKNIFDIKNSDALETNYLETFNSYLNAGATESFRLTTNHKDAIKQTLFDFTQNPHIGDNELMKALTQAHNYLAKKLEKEFQMNKESVALDPEYQLLTQMILQVNNAHLMAGDLKEKTQVDIGARILSNASDKGIRVLDRVIKENNMRINTKILDWHNKKERVLAALMKSKSIGVVDTILTNDITSIFDDMWLINPKNITDEIRENRPNDLYVLKDVEDLNTQEEKDFVNFFKDTILDALKISLSPAEYQKVLDEKTWKQYMVPLMPASFINRISNEEDLKKKFGLMVKSFSKTTKAATKELEEIGSIMNNDFLSQLGGGVQNGKARRNLLNITADGKITGEFKALESNLEKIMTMFFLKSVAGEQHNRTLSFHNALQAHALYEQYANFNKTEEVRKAMDTATNIRVKNEVKDEGKVGKRIDWMQRMLSSLTFAFNTGFMVQEAATNVIASLSSSVTQTFMGKHQVFSGKNWVHASKYVVGQVANKKSALITSKLTKSLGLYNADPISWGKKEKMLTNKNGFFQSRWGFFLNNIPFQSFKTIHIFAEMDKLGALKCMDVNENEDLVYNYTEDDRFKGIFDSEGNVKKDLEESWKTTPILKQKAALYEYYMQEWAKDGTLNAEGKPTLPVSFEQVMSMQDRSLATFGSMDNDAALLFQYYFMGRMFLKFKSWYAVKKDNYWTESHMSEVRGKLEWVEDPDHPLGGTYKFEHEHVEGIIQTLMHLGNLVADMKRNKSFKASGFKDLSPRQRENLTKAAVDIAMVALLTSLITGAMDDKDDIFGSGMGKNLGKVLQNGIGDLNMWSVTSDMVSQNPLALLGQMSRMINTLKNEVFVSAAGDFAKTQHYLGKLTGVTKFFVTE